MVDTKHNNCSTCKLKQTSYNYPIEKHSLYCNDCKKCGMTDVRREKCIHCNLSTPHRKSNAHCAFYSISLSPKDPKSTKSRTSKELKVVNIQTSSIINHSMLI